MDSPLASTSPKSFRICQRGTEAGWGRVSSTGELYGRSRSHVVVERVAVAVMERNPHASVEVVRRMRDRDGPLNDQDGPGLVCNLGVVLGQGVWGVSIRRAATIGPSRVARQLVPLVIGT